MTLLPEVGSGRAQGGSAALVLTAVGAAVGDAGAPATAGVTPAERGKAAIATSSRASAQPARAKVRLMPVPLNTVEELVRALTPTLSQRAREAWHGPTVAMTNYTLTARPDGRALGGRRWQRKSCCSTARTVSES